MTTETTVSNLKINKLTKQQYEGITTPSSTELYLVTDDSGITSSDVTTALGYTPVKKYTTTNPSITVSGGVGSWTVTHNLNMSSVDIAVYEVSSGEKVCFDSSIASANAVTISILSASNISADTYRVVIQG